MTTKQNSNLIRIKVGSNEKINIHFDLNFFVDDV